MTTSFRVKTLIAPDKRQLRTAVWDVPESVAPRGICLVLQGLTEFLEKYDETARRTDGARIDRRQPRLAQPGRFRAQPERQPCGPRHELRRIRRGSRARSSYTASSPIQKDRIALGQSPLPVIALAHSMGAHILLRYIHEHKRRLAGAVLTAPMLGIETGKYSPQFTRWVTFILNLRRPSSRLIFTVEDRDPLHLPFEDNLVTSDRARFERNRDYLKAQPFLRIYGPTFGWLGAAFRSLRRMERKDFAEEIITPLLIVGAGRDRIVTNAATRDFVKRLPNAKYVEIEDAEHEILMESDAIRARFWAEFDAFTAPLLSEKA